MVAADVLSGIGTPVPVVVYLPAPGNSYGHGRWHRSLNCGLLKSSDIHCGLITKWLLLVAMSCKVK